MLGLKREQTEYLNCINCVQGEDLAWGKILGSMKGRIFVLEKSGIWKLEKLLQISDTVLVLERT